MAETPGPARGGEERAGTLPVPVVHKFGGSSVADAERIRQTAGVVADQDPPVVVVVSALAGVTDTLVAAARALLRGTPDGGGAADELLRRHLEVLAGLGAGDDDRETVAGEVAGVLRRLREPAPADRAPEEVTDAILSVGEDLSARLVALALRSLGHDAAAVDARRFVRTDARFGRARPDDDAIRELVREHLLPETEGGRIAVVPGFVGATADGRTTTLGRGGSDYTAALLGSALGSDVVHIWTDVDGILSGDPRAVDHPRALPEIGFEEAVELSYFGARVIHPGAAKHAVSRGLHVRVRNTLRPEAPGTRILSDRRGVTEIAAVAYKPDVALIKVRSHPSAMPYGFLARVFEILARHQLPVDLVATSHSSTAFTLDESEELAAVGSELAAFAEVEIATSLATVTVVGHGLMAEPGTDALVFWAVERTPVHLISQASDVSLSFVVDQADALRLVRTLHLTLIELRDAEARERME